jgi:hypothetical protein
MNGALRITTGYVRPHYGSSECSHVDRQVQRRLFGAVTRPKILSDVEGALTSSLFAAYPYRSARVPLPFLRRNNELRSPDVLLREA